MLKHDFFENMRKTTLKTILETFAAYFLIFAIQPESLSTLAYSKGVLKVSINLPAVIPDISNHQKIIDQIVRLKQQGQSTTKLENRLEIWRNAMPPYDSLKGYGPFLAESKLFLYLYRTERYEAYKRWIETGNIYEYETGSWWKGYIIEYPIKERPW